MRGDTVRSAVVDSPAVSRAGHGAHGGYFTYVPSLLFTEPAKLCFLTVFPHFSFYPVHEPGLDRIAMSSVAHQSQHQGDH